MFTKKTVGIALTIALVIAMVLLVQKNLGEVAHVLCIFYSIATGLFFLAQLYGFIVCQTEYCEKVEEPKFTMLENEEKEWQFLVKS